MKLRILAAQEKFERDLEEHVFALTVYHAVYVDKVPDDSWFTQEQLNRAVESLLAKGVVARELDGKRIKRVEFPSVPPHLLRYIPLDVDSDA